MKTGYQDPKTHEAYLRYLAGKDAQIEQELVWQNLKSRLPLAPRGKVLDAACGSGWLTARLASLYKEPQGVDSSEKLISLAQKEHPAINFAVADLLAPLPFPPESFDAAIFNMAAHDVSDLPAALVNLKDTLKPGGLLLMTVANPYYSFPAGVWKRGLLRFLLGMKPKLKLRPYNKLAFQDQRGFRWKGGIQSYFRTLPEYIQAALKAGLSLAGVEEIISKEDSSGFDRAFQLHRYPLILLLEFKKGGE